MFKKLSLLFCLSFWATFSQAAPITWTLDGVTFDDGGVATGNLVFDADINAVLDWNISVSGGDESTFPVLTYTPTPVATANVFDTGAALSLQIYVDGFIIQSRLISLTTDGPLTDAGGTVSLLSQITTPSGLWESVECYNCNPYRLIVSGSLNAVPVPAAVWLFGSGLIGLAGFARRKKP